MGFVDAAMRCGDLEAENEQLRRRLGAVRTSDYARLLQAAKQWRDSDDPLQAAAQLRAVINELSGSSPDTLEEEK